MYKLENGKYILCDSDPVWDTHWKSGQVETYNTVTKERPIVTKERLQIEVEVHYYGDAIYSKLFFHFTEAMAFAKRAIKKPRVKECVIHDTYEWKVVN